jgi:formylglycine-generating enzyme
MTGMRFVVSLAVVGAIASAALDGGQRGDRTASKTTWAAPKVEIAAALAATEPPAAPATEPAAPSAATCPDNMVEVVGDYCPAVEQICEEYISEKRDRCARFRQTSRCLTSTQRKTYCIDKYEYPNQAGTKPTVAVTFNEAAQVCQSEGKRLCSAEEWTLACEGPERTPYPNGYDRDPTACNYDRTYIIPDDAAYQNPATRSAEIARVNQSEASGSRESCVSSYGVHDMTGNVDEWVLNGAGSANGPEYESGLKGGYWGPVRNRCRPMTTDHNRWHHGYQIGFRCCSEVGATAPAPSAPPANEAGSSRNSIVSSTTASTDVPRS